MRFKVIIDINSNLYFFACTVRNNLPPLHAQPTRTHTPLTSPHRYGPYQTTAIHPSPVRTYTALTNSQRDTPSLAEWEEGS
nr:MAG TPA: hypothetical protein [Caudoviricetes sp.]